MSASKWLLQVPFLLMALFAIASAVLQAVGRLKAGRPRMRLPMASLANPPTSTTTSTILFAFATLATVPAAWMGTDPNLQALPVLFLLMLVQGLQTNSQRRESRPWLVLLSGLIALAGGALMTAIAARSLRGGASPLDTSVTFALAFAAFFFAFGAPPIREYLGGTRIYDGGIEMLGAIHPWSRVAVQGWEEHERGFALRLRVRSPRLAGLPLAGDAAMIVPVPAADREALEGFLAGRLATVAYGP